MVEEMTTPSSSSALSWTGCFDPLDDYLWFGQSNCDWIKPSQMQDLMTMGFNETGRYPWYVSDLKKARTMVQENREAVLSIIGSLMSWRNATVSQLQAGLVRYPVPEFTRSSPNLYGALSRVGALNIGFSKREYIANVYVPQVWLGLNGIRGQVSKVTRLAAGYGYPTDAIIRPGVGTHQYARHNTCASHVGLAFAHDSRVKYTAGDGWALFRRLDAQATGEMGIHFNNVPDLLGFTTRGVVAAIEVQSALTDVPKKMRAWVDFLSHSPMSRRGLLCIWLLIPSVSQGMANFTKIFEEAMNLPGVTVGEPPVSDRIGWANWYDWFDQQGNPTDRLGTFTDLMGHERSMFDTDWGLLPQTADYSELTDWGWNLMNRSILDVFGWDTSTWVKPDLYRGDSYGFIGGLGEKDGDR